jgi:type II secretion system (T2SS) protein E
MSLAAGSATRLPSGFENLPGVTAPISREPSSGFLSDRLVELDLVAAPMVENAVHESRARGIPPELLLVAHGHLSESGLARARAEHAGLDCVDLDVFERDRDADALIGRAAAERFHALPIAIEGRSLVVAIADPLDTPALAEIAELARCEVIPVVAAASAIDARTDELPEHSGDEPEPVPEPTRLHPIEGGGARSSASPPPAIPSALADRIVERVDATLDEVARSELVKALDEATVEIEQLSAKLTEVEQRAQTLERERDELRAALSDQA